MGKLEGKVALVTGSGRNIGRATVLKLAREGAHVVVNARSNQQEAEAVAREARELGAKALAVLADVGKKAEVEALAARALSEFGRAHSVLRRRRLDFCSRQWPHSFVCGEDGADRHGARARLGIRSP